MKNSIIIVLGNWMDKSGQLNIDSCSRLDLAIDIFRKSKHAFIVTCGWDYNSEFNIAIADVMKSYIVLHKCRKIFHVFLKRDNHLSLSTSYSYFFS